MMVEKAHTHIDFHLTFLPVLLRINRLKGELEKEKNFRR